MKLFLSRAACGALAILAIAGCETRLTTEGGLDAVNPFITLSTPGQDPDAIDVSTQFKVTVSATDNLSLREIFVGVAAGGNITASYDTLFTSAVPTFTREVPVSLTNAIAGQQITIVAVAEDGAGNFGSDTLVITVTDPSAPNVVITAPAGGTIYRAGAPISIGVTASDLAGVDKIGYQILQITATGFETVFQEDSIIFNPAVSPVSRNFPTTVADTLLPGTYLLRGIARDLTGNRAFSAPVSLIVQDAIKPGLDLLSPPADSSITLGSDIIAEAHLTDNVGVARFSIVGIATRGDPDLGVVDTIVRFDSVYAPVNVSGRPQSFRPGLRDTTVRRLLIPTNRADSLTEPIYLIARVTDVAGNDSIVIRRVQLVSGPAIRIVRPGNGAIAAPGKSLVVEVRAADKDGVRSIGFRITSATFNEVHQGPTPTQPPDTLTFIQTITVPLTFPPNSSFTITPFGTDNVGQPGAGPSVIVQVLAPGADTQGPLVYQTLRDRVESDDFVDVRAIDPSGIAYIGFTMTAEATGVEIFRDSVVANTAFTDTELRLPLVVPAQYVGQKIVIVAFARDASGNIGYAVPSTTATPAGTPLLATPDTALVVYGRTFSLPKGGLAADIAVDTLRSMVYLSNLTFDRLEIFQGLTNTFASKTVAVGSDPWGLFIDNTGNTLLVANSGGTNISRVFIGTTDLTQINEDVASRIKTPNAVIADVTVSLSNGVARYKIEQYDFSDRPQYIAQSITNEIYYSTKPTETAPDGTIRHYDPNFPNPDVRMIWQYATRKGTENVAVINADSVYALISPLETQSDSIVICDHPYGSTAPSLCFQSDLISSALAAAQAYGSDVVGVGAMDVASIGLTDTTFVAAGGDRRWIAFGEGNTGGTAGRIMMSRDPGDFFSPATTVADLTNNASEAVFGLAINSNSTSIAAHGKESYFADIESPFHLRLQGKFNTFDTGAGVAYHPLNAGDTPALDDPTRVVFVASADGTIDILDSFHYTTRGKLPVRANLYGPIRVTNRFAGDDPAVVLKLFGLTTEGLIVIDIRAEDIKPLSTP
jgi:hypothetical protein